MTQKIEIITGTDRRRRYSDLEKEDLVQKTLAPGTNVSAIARQHGVAPSLLFKWRKDFLERQGVLSAESSTALANLPNAFARVAQVATDVEREAEEGAIFLHLGDQLIVELPAATTPVRLSAIVQALRRD